MEDSRVTYSDLEGNALREQLRHDIRHTDRSAWLKVFFLQNMSHELRSPLTAICGFSNLISELRSNSVDEEMRQLATRISESSTSLLKEINQLLNSTREECMKRLSETGGELRDDEPPADTPTEALFDMLNKARQHETARTELIDQLSTHVHTHIDAIVDFAHKLASDATADDENAGMDISEFVELTSATGASSRAASTAHAGRSSIRVTSARCA